MSNNLYTTLGYQDNRLVSKYREKQFQKLLDLLKKYFSDDIFQKFTSLDQSKQKEFIFHPDHASILTCLEFIDSPETHKQKFITELEKFLIEDYDSMIAYSGHKIDGTSLYLTIDDLNPLNSIDIHPDGGGGVGWGEKKPEEWKKVYDNTFSLLKKIDDDFHVELCAMLKKIVAYGTAEHIHYSASYKECVGTLYMGYTLGTDIEEFHVLEGLIHESSHNKLNLIMQFEDIVLNDFQEVYYSPYRPDARHIYGVLLGIHALVPTVYVMLKGVKKGLISDYRWIEKIVLYHIKNKLGIATMKKFGKLSPMGSQLLNDIIEVSQISDSLVKEVLQEAKISLPQVQKKAKEHFLEVNKNYPYLKY